MAYIEWDDAMSVGVPVLDADHQRLIRLLNAFVEALENDEGLMVTDSIFAALGDYVVTHFAREEEILAEAGYADLEPHKAAHRALESKFAELRDSYVLNPDKRAEKRVEDFLIDWLKSHILKTDMKYRDVVAKVAAAHPAA